jgi:hypothetical protein
VGPKPWRNRPPAVRNARQISDPPRRERDLNTLRGEERTQRLVRLPSLRSARVAAGFRLSFKLAAVEFGNSIRQHEAHSTRGWRKINDDVAGFQPGPSRLPEDAAMGP